MKGREFSTAEAPIAFIDLEMSGLEPMKHEILEIALVRASQPELEILETWTVKVKPEHLETADPKALEISGYIPEKWQDAITIREAMEVFAAKTENHILAGWNVFYDWVFLEVNMGNVGVKSEIHKHILDVMSFAYGKLHDRFSFGEAGLQEVTRYLGINLGNQHQALADTMATYEVYKKLVADQKPRPPTLRE